jgi:hypothetical protein
MTREGVDAADVRRKVHPPVPDRNKVLFFAASPAGLRANGDLPQLRERDLGCATEVFLVRRRPL